MDEPQLMLALRRIAHGRTGDKGGTSNISVIAWRPEFWPLLRDTLDADRVAAHFAARHPTRVRRFVLEGLQALNFVLDDVLDGGVNDSLNLDAHGKSLAFHLLELELAVPAHWRPLLAGPPLGAHEAVPIPKSARAADASRSDLP